MDHIGFDPYNMPLIPVMTSNNSPSGVASASSELPKYQAYKAFDGDNSSQWLSIENGSASNIYLMYKFPKAVCAKKFSLSWEGNVTSASYKMQASNDNSQWIDLTDNITNVGSAEISKEISNSKYYTYYRLYINNQNFPNSNYSCGTIMSLQLYGD